MLTTLIILIAVAALLSVALEDVFHINKAKSTLFLGTLSWLVLFMGHGPEHLPETVASLDENLLEIANLWLFLMATMTFVAYLNSKGLVSYLVIKLLPGELTLAKLTALVGGVGFLLSSVCDNITATLVLLGAVQAFRLELKERVRLAVLIVFAVNSGGVVLITGDVTTLMIFSADKVSMVDLLQLFLPALVGVAVLTACMTFMGNRQVKAELEAPVLTWVDYAVSTIFIGTIILAISANLLFGVPPVLSFLFGLSLMFLVGSLAHSWDHQTRLLEYVRQIQFDTLLFFLGILLMVGALQEVGVLSAITRFYLDLSPELANYAVGLLSSVLDNVPLTAALIKADPALSTDHWLGLTYAAGVGGSLLAIGSAAGIVAMSKVPGLTFMQYARYSPLILLSFSIGYGLVLVF